MSEDAFIAGTDSTSTKLQSVILDLGTGKTAATTT